tara:strand:- start:940 stop:1905 length:966 start_codon:yes stop_codon:yes gene_type:complete
MMRSQFQCWLRILCLACLGLLPSQATATLSIVTSLPEYEALAKEIVGWCSPLCAESDEITITSLGRGTEDLHFVNPKPSYIRILNNADVLIQNGAGVDEGWLPPLIAASRNPKLVLSFDSPTRIMAAQFVDMLQLPSTQIDRSMGDIHLLGHPHFHLSPTNAILIAKGLTEKFCFLQPDSCSRFTRNLNTFEKRIEKKLPIWQKQMKPLRNVNVIEYHQTFAYLAKSFGLGLVGDELEPKPGIPPSAAHIRKLIPRMNAMDVKLLLIEPFHERKTPTFIAQQTKAKVVIIPSTIGGVPGTDDYISLIDTIVSRLVLAYASH